MELSRDARAIVDALLDENYAWLAGELLEELAAGARPDVTAGDVDDFVLEKSADSLEDPLRAKPEPVRRPYDVAQDRPAEPIPREKHAAFAISFLRTRLVEPFRRLGEAERIANRLVVLQADRTELNAKGDRRARTTDKPVRFALVEGEPLDQRPEEDGTPAAEELASALNVLAQAAARA